MPSWWGRKSAKNRDHLKQNPIVVVSKNHVPSIKNKNGKKSFDDSSSSGFSGFDSDRIGHPLPQPSLSPTTSLALTDLQGSASVSSSGASSISSAGDHTLDHNQFRGYGKSKFSPQPRSPGPVSRVETATTSPLHPRLVGSSLDSPNKRLDECHPLPLPPPVSVSLTCPPATRVCSSPSRPAAVVSNYQLSKWKKGRLLGRGTFGHVYLGFNSESGQMCAIKEVKVVVNDRSSKDSLKQLNQEITLLSHLSHPNIVQYYGSELGEETLSVYLEYVSGGSIHKLLQEYGPFREPVIQNYTRQVLSGLAYLHGRNTVLGCNEHKWLQPWCRYLELRMYSY
ncbi:hypothetical protein L1987_78673 [Smallanthus sonchifolius]|uniref:Uncharacterized protein n=1 Tax=Smallanthus sonchifolius TaxID=185202 RepID=A0ACB8ZDB0_9ASTR|nr:hypothetical protein L1987_78673 [Smallanthus sonchifolius]